MGSIPVFPSIPPGMTDDIYWAAQTDPIQTLRPLIKAGVDEDTYSAAVQKLLQAGEILDRQIHAWRWPPTSVMQNRVIDGYSWVPSIGQADVVNVPGPRSIKVSINPIDYPPFDKPVQAPPPIPVPPCPIGIYETGTFYGRVPGDKSKIGDKWMGTLPNGVTKGTWVLVDLAELIGDVVLWNKIA